MGCCCVCESEDGRGTMRLIDRDADGCPTDPICLGLFRAVYEAARLRVDEGCSHYELYAKDWDRRVSDVGCAMWVCLRCLSETKPKRSSSGSPRTLADDEVSSESGDDSGYDDEDGIDVTDAFRPPPVSGCGRLPSRAIANHLYAGPVPDCLACLTRVELSMISLINPVLTLAIMRKRKAQFEHTIGTIFSVIRDDAVERSESFPSMPTLDSYCVLKGRGGSTRESSLKFRPRRVLEALNWLKSNNRFHRDILIDASVFGDNRDDDFQELDERVQVELDGEDEEDVDATLAECRPEEEDAAADEHRRFGCATNAGARGFEPEVAVILPQKTAGWNFEV